MERYLVSCDLVSGATSLRFAATYEAHTPEDAAQAAKNEIQQKLLFNVSNLKTGKYTEVDLRTTSHKTAE